MLCWSKQVKKSGDQVRNNDCHLTETHLETADVLAKLFDPVFVNE